jgi:hypothetical protein
MNPSEKFLFGTSPEPARRTALDIFFHVNRDLTEWQREVIELVFGPENGPDEYAEAILKITQKVQLLNDAGWKPNRAGGDMVNKPSHYDRYPIEPTYFIIENGIDWLRGNFLKYVCRFPFKNGVEDLSKAARNLAMYIKYLDGDPSWSR